MCFSERFFTRGVGIEGVTLKSVFSSCDGLCSQFGKCWFDLLLRRNLECLCQEREERHLNLSFEYIYIALLSAQVNYFTGVLAECGARWNNKIIYMNELHLRSSPGD
jgi:hypothetical protein